MRRRARASARVEERFGGERERDRGGERESNRGEETREKEKKRKRERKAKEQRRDQFVLSLSFGGNERGAKRARERRRERSVREVIGCSLRAQRMGIVMDQPLECVPFFLFVSPYTWRAALAPLRRRRRRRTSRGQSCRPATGRTDLVREGACSKLKKDRVRY